MYKEVKGLIIKDYDPEIVAWERGNVETVDAPLLYSFPQATENIKNKKYFSVKDYQKALFYNKGELLGILGGGVYELEKKARIKGTEIVWIDTSLIDIQWGIPQSNGIPTLDGFFLGLHGDLRLKIGNVKVFYNDVVAGKKEWTIRNLKEWIMSLLLSSFRDIFKNHKAREVVLEDRERVLNLVIAKVTEELSIYGLELETINIVGVKAPEGTDKLFQVEREKSRVTDEVEMLKMKTELETQKMELESTKKEFERKQKVLDAQMELEKTKFKAEAEKIEGEVKTDLLGKQQEAIVSGKVKVIEAVGDKAAEIAKLDERERIKQKITDLKEKLDKFDDLLAEDKITKEAYNVRIERIEKELSELEKLL
ncbi:MAG: SPFH domain-containing protein [Promethearchaeota archaeon]